MTSTPILGPAVSIDAGASMFLAGELVLVRIPFPLDTELRPTLDTSTAAGSGIPPTSNARSPQHFAFVRTATPLADGVELEVFPMVSFSRTGGAINGYNDMTDEQKATLIPLSRFMPTEPLTVGGWINTRNAWLLVIPAKFIVTASRPFKRFIPPIVMNPQELSQVERYRNALLAQTGIPHNSQGPPQLPPGTGSGNTNGQGGDGYGQGAEQRGLGNNGTGQAGRSLGDLLCCTRGDGGVSEETANITSTLLLPILELEGVDADAQDADATMKDELMLLAHTSEIWRGALEKYMQAENREREAVQKEQEVRLETWLHSL